MAGVLLVATACGAAAHGGATISGSPSYVPWLPLAQTGVYPQAPKPSPSPPIPVPPGTPACNSSQLEVTFYGQGGATGHLNTPLWLRNRSTTECVLQGYPDVTLLDAQNKVLAAASGSAHRGTFFDTEGVVPVLMKTGTASLQAVQQNQQPPASGQARFNVEWVDCTMPTASRVVVDLPDGGGRLTAVGTVRAGYSPACDLGPGIAPQPTVARGPFLPTGVEWPPSPAYITTSVTIKAPEVVKRGSILVYFVTVHNTSDIDYVLNPCPDYNEFMGKKDVVASYRLNCAPVGHIAPGAAVTFEMHLAVPSWIESGPSRLVWALGDGRLGPANAGVPITIAG